jgi:hypothetical protein
MGGIVTATMPAADTAEIIRAMTAFMPPGTVTEIRALEATGRGERYAQIWSGYFDCPQKIAAAISTLTEWKAVYFILNGVDSSLLARACNRIRPAKKNPLTSDGDIIRRRFLPIDTDPVRVSGISSTDAEHDAAIERAEYIASDLALEGWQAPIYGDSGNGGHAVYAIDLPTDDGGLVQRCLEALDKKYSDDVVKIDTSVFNPSRVWKVYGSIVRKGDDTPDRPHRHAKIIGMPRDVVPVPRELIEELASKAPSVQAATGRRST